MSQAPRSETWNAAKASSSDSGWNAVKASSPESGWNAAKASSPDAGWNAAKASDMWSMPDGQPNTGKSVS